MVHLMTPLWPSQVLAKHAFLYHFQIGAATIGHNLNQQPYQEYVMRPLVLVMLALIFASLGWDAQAGDDKKSGATKAIKVVTPFNGQDLSNWKFRGNAKESKWIVGRAHGREKSAFPVCD